MGTYKLQTTNPTNVTTALAIIICNESSEHDWQALCLGIHFQLLPARVNFDVVLPGYTVRSI